jgi:hypothetical protein
VWPFTPKKKTVKFSASQLFTWRHSHCISSVTPLILTADDS